MTYSSRTDDIDLGWADLGDDDDRPVQRRSGMDRDPQDPDVDPAQLLAELPPRSGAGSMPASGASFDDLGTRPEWHAASPPAPVAAAWAALEGAVDAAVDAERAERALVGEEQQAERLEAARVRTAIASGKAGVKASASVRDWAAERRHLASVAAGHRERARRARDEYDAAVEQHRQAWSGLLLASLPDSKAATLDALAKAGLMVERLLADATAAQTLALEPGGSVVPLPVLPARRFHEAMRALADEISASPQLAGVDLVHPVMTPPYRERQQIGAMLLHGVVDSSVHWLAELERREQYRFSSFTRGVPLPKPSDPTW